MSMTQGCLFDPEAMKNVVISPAWAREFEKNAMPMRGFQHLDGRILLTQVGPIPRKKNIAHPNKLHLMLHGKWFDTTLYGDKRVEYRQIKPRWTKQIWEKRDTLKTIVLHRGYTNNVIRATITKIDIGPCPYPGWDGDYYRIWFALAGEIG